jgi:hypothetical protein
MIVSLHASNGRQGQWPDDLPGYRLALARVSVVRGEGPSAGLPCIDDHVRCAEPIHDHLTRYRWVNVLTCTRLYLYSSVSVLVCICTRLYLYSSVSVLVCICTRLYLYSSVSVLVCIWASKSCKPYPTTVLLTMYASQIHHTPGGGLCLSCALEKCGKQQV